METAIHADTSVLNAFNSIKSAKVGHSNTLNDSLKRLSGDDGFKALQRVIDGHIKQLEEMQGAVEPSDSVEAIGFKFLACRIAIERLKVIRNLPQSLVEAERHGIK